MKLKNTLLSILSKINLKNFDKGMGIFNKNMNKFNKSMKQFGNAMDSMTKELSTDIKKSNERAESQAKRGKENMKKIWGKSDVKIWSDKKTEL